MRTNNFRVWALVALLAIAGTLAFGSSASAQYWRWQSHNHASGYSGPYHGSYYSGPAWSPYNGTSVYSPNYGYGTYNNYSRYNGYSYYPGYSLSGGATPDGIVIGSVGAPYYYGGRYYYYSPMGGNFLR